MIKPGERFGQWTIGERAPNEKYYPHVYNCVCDCGTNRIVKENNLKNGRSRSCGMCQGPRKRISDSTRAEVQALIEAGIKSKEIAARCGVSVATVYVLRRKTLAKVKTQEPAILALAELEAIDWRIMAAEGDCENLRHPTWGKMVEEPHRCGECVNCRVLQAIRYLRD